MDAFIHVRDIPLGLKVECDKDKVVAPDMQWPDIVDGRQALFDRVDGGV